MADLINQIYEILAFWGHNLKTNLILTFVNVEAKVYIRLIAVVGAYLLLRPYLIKLGARAQRKEHEKADNPPDAIPAKISPNSLRGRVEVPDDDSEEEGTATTTAGEANWGKKARKRQRQVVRKLLEKEEERLRELEEEEEDRELEEFLMRNCATGKEVSLES